MMPKVEAAIDFLEAGGEEVIITDPHHLVQALDGKAGTHISTKELYETIARD
jgi:carbamate kinase